MLDINFDEILDSTFTPVSKRGGPLYNQTIESSLSNKEESKKCKKDVLASSSEEECSDDCQSDGHVKNLFAVAEADKSSDEQEQLPSLKKPKVKGQL